MVSRKEEIIAFITANKELHNAWKEAKKFSKENGFSKAEYAKTISELLAEKKFAATPEELMDLFESREPIELSEETLDKVAGGLACDDSCG